MADEKVSVTALRYHTHDGQEYHDGDTYEADASAVGNLTAQGMAKATADVEADKMAHAALHPVEPMTTDDFGKG